MKRISWSARAEQDFTKQMAYLEAHASKKSVLQYMAEVAQAIENISSKEVVYQLVDDTKRIRRYKVNKFIDLYYKETAQDKVVLLTFFDRRQNPGKLKL
ncbi:type II toxin-antitoxin system RelE/ParE family toxin [Rhodocytophaga aerolata]|uniref:Type II toxin-antitoxin system RelE/ParE family toxin n=1 Tax=Rhodocytophaga aerolata TaxID=455078 RepID=A0ABT8RKD7_9BACT|nr:type II toxin-antitoxin system RelE/ParE family toxin [Rhodocytophaga aerolata]MDO1451843.1 type II toxin-antitoxin system RelE/ParE family toxin [Rhodocytophaga aerolata]